MALRGACPNFDRLAVTPAFVRTSLAALIGLSRTLAAIRCMLRHSAWPIYDMVVSGRVGRVLVRPPRALVRELKIPVMCAFSAAITQVHGVSVAFDPIVLRREALP